ncbi:DUF2200 domain-containing protein [Helcobacillus massiliensis]|uniref:DUF2200 domain-containing protein n=1 Tax=Helcobacillus massiliensis TaxID=521392 RepID=UPI0021A4A68B|nr:DUF2200 domain-containing protein [Helcobacillus massiliensis]MCT1556888.1 DUF2200 domain-containing protein [Helcobacillus massiliensis]MCT2037489.1 DUF2200 domain-containing protein [Helcobacillus massiliensis]MCT2331508.1 DUF2200 domain-containing protein [Helcobacillus massiliensis]
MTTDPKLERVFQMRYGDIDGLYQTKVERKGHTREELDHVLTWLTGYSTVQLREQAASPATLREFFADAPQMHPNTDLITGVLCGVRVEDIEDPLMQKIRWMDKLVDEVARGKKMENILRS